MKDIAFWVHYFEQAEDIFRLVLRVPIQTIWSDSTFVPSGISKSSTTRMAAFLRSRRERNIRHRSSGHPVKAFVIQIASIKHIHACVVVHKHFQLVPIMDFGRSHHCLFGIGCAFPWIPAADAAWRRLWFYGILPICDWSDSKAMYWNQ